MTITVVSKHLPVIWRHVGRPGRPAGDSLLELLHLVESARYHLHRFEVLTRGEDEAPSNFESGIDAYGEELNHYWRFMAAWIELESFLFSSKQFLDRAWRCLGERVGCGAENIATLPKAINNLTTKVKDKEVVNLIRQRPYFVTLVEAWNEWGQELAGIRNYVEHHASFGGLALAHGATIARGEHITHLYLPDESPQWMENPPKRTFTFEKRRSALEYLRNRINDIDSLVAKLMYVDEPLFYLEEA